MGMPMELLLVRHGESEGNAAIRASRTGDESLIERPEFRARHSSSWRLTERGVEQATATGAWVKREIGYTFDRCYTSADTRAVETAGHLGLPQAFWDVELLLRGREWGVWETPTASQRKGFTRSSRIRAQNPFFWRPEHGESMADVVLRTQEMLHKLERLDSGKRVIVVCHSEILRAVHFTLMQMTPNDYDVWRRSEAPEDQVRNGQIFHYTRRDPVTGAVGSTPRAWRSVSAIEPEFGTGGWRTMRPKMLDNDQLIALAEMTPRLGDV